MTNEYSRAISFANSYFDLVDGLAYGLEDHLAEDVSLYWFGKIVNGKRNVAAFMRINMTNSRHIFDEITPASSIGQHRKRKTRRKHKSEEGSFKIENLTDPLDKSELNFAKLCIEDCNNGKKDNIQPDKPRSSVFLEEIGVDRSENISDNSVKRENNKDETFIPLIPKMDCESSVQSLKTDESTINFIKANGIVHIHRATGPNKIRKWQSSAFVSGLPGQNCRRHCKLRVAYSWRNDQAKKCQENNARSRNLSVNTEKSSESSDRSMIINADEAKKITITKGRKRLKSQEDEVEKLEGIVDSQRSFDPFEDFDSFDDKRRFFEYYRAEMRPRFNFTSAKYVDEPLILERKSSKETASKNCPERSLRFDYFIHSLVYESNTSSSLFEEFEDRTSLSDTEKSV